MIYGKSIYLWKIKDVSQGKPDVIATTARDMKMRAVLIKAAGGTGMYNLSTLYQDTIMGPVVDALRGVGVEVWAWHYVYGKQPEQEAARLMERQARYKFDGWVIDAEGEYKLAGGQAAQRYLAGLNGLKVPIGLSTYRYPNVHPEFPWNEFISSVDFVLPQVYWQGKHNPAEQLDESMDQYSGLKYNRPYVPTGAAYHEWGWQPTLDDIRVFFERVRYHNLPGCCWWEWGHAQRYGFQETIGALVWKAIETVPLDQWARAVDEYLRLHGYSGPAPEVG